MLVRERKSVIINQKPKGVLPGMKNSHHLPQRR